MDLLAVGAALVDIVSFADYYDLPPKLGVHNYSFSHRPIEDMAAIVASLPHASYSAGGGAATTAKVAARLGLKAGFFGAVGRDIMGEIFIADMEESGVELKVARKASPTGLCCVIIDPGHGRTLVASPSAARELEIDELGEEAIAGARAVYADGYLLGCGSLVPELLSSARYHGKITAFDLGSEGIARARCDELLELADGQVDYVFANKREIEALCGLTFEETLPMLGELDCVFVVKFGAEGAMAAGRGERVVVGTEARIALDKTGCGDSFAAAFLDARLRGADLAGALARGNEVAGRILGVPGSSSLNEIFPR